MPPETRKGFAWGAVFSTLILLLLACYALWSRLARLAFANLEYLTALLGQSGYEPLYLILFLISASLTALLLARRLGQYSSPAPTFCLFLIGGIVVPPQVVALLAWPDGRGWMRSVVLLGISLSINVLLTGWVLLCKQNSPKEPPLQTEEDGTWQWGYSLTTGALLLLVFLSSAGRLVGFDALAYHLPLVASWFHSGSLKTGYGAQFHYPENMNLLVRWTLASGSDKGIFLIPFLSALLCVYMLYKISRALGFSREVATVSACCGAVCPPFIHLATTAYSDTFGILCLTLGIYFLLEWNNSKVTHWAFPLSLGLALGMAAGTKFSMLPPAVVIFCASAVVVFQKGDRVKSVAWLAASAFLGGGYWYLRNLVAFGNPVYPVSVAGLPGIPMAELVAVNPLLDKPTWRWMAYPWVEFGYSSPFDDGVGAVFGSLCIPAMMVCPLLFWKMRKDGKALRLNDLLVYSIVVGSFLLYLLSGRVTPRYGLASLVLSSLLIGFLWREFNSRYFRFAVFVPFGFMLFVLGQSFLTSCLYTLNTPTYEGAERFGLPKTIDELMPARILNAAAAHYTYGLMGKDYRHEVITLFRSPAPEDALTYGADHILVDEDRLAEFQSKLNIALVAETQSVEGKKLSLWRMMHGPP